MAMQETEQFTDVAGTWERVTVTPSASGCSVNAFKNDTLKLAIVSVDSGSLSSSFTIDVSNIPAVSGIAFYGAMTQNGGPGGYLHIQNNIISVTITARYTVGQILYPIQ